MFREYNARKTSRRDNLYDVFLRISASSDPLLLNHYYKIKPTPRIRKTLTPDMLALLKPTDEYSLKWIVIYCNEWISILYWFMINFHLSVHSCWIHVCIFVKTVSQVFLRSKSEHKFKKFHAKKTGLWLAGIHLNSCPVLDLRRNWLY